MWYSSLDDPILYDTGVVLCMRLTNERRRYIVTSSTIGWGIHNIISLIPSITIRINDVKYCSLTMFAVINIFQDTDAAKPLINTIIMCRLWTSTWFSLQMLELSNNEIVDIHDLAFSELNRLQDLNIYRNHLVNAPSLSCVKSTLEKSWICMEYDKPYQWPVFWLVQETKSPLCKQ